MNEMVYCSNCDTFKHYNKKLSSENPITCSNCDTTFHYERKKIIKENIVLQRYLIENREFYTVFEYIYASKNTKPISLERLRKKMVKAPNNYIAKGTLNNIIYYKNDFNAEEIEEIETNIKYQKWNYLSTETWLSGKKLVEMKKFYVENNY